MSDAATFTPRSLGDLRDGNGSFPVGDLFAAYNVATHKFSAVTGTLVIKLPVYQSDVKADFTIRGFRYRPNVAFASWSCRVSISDFAAGISHAVGAEIEGDSPFDSVRFGRLGTDNRVILLGTTSTSWGTTGAGYASVSDVVSTLDNLGTGWEISLVTDESAYTIERTVVPTRNGVINRSSDSVPTTPKANTSTAYETLEVVFGTQFCRLGVYDPGTGIPGRRGYVQSGFTESALVYGLVLNPLGGDLIVGPNDDVAISNNGLHVDLSSGSHLRFSSTGTYDGTKDTGLARDAAGVSRTTNGSSGSGDHKVNALRLVPIATASRPAAGVRGRQIYDTTIGKPIWDDGSQWRDAAGTIV